MTWARLDDRFPQHPKVIGLTDRAFRAHVEAICYGCAHLTDGFVPESVFRRRSKAVAELVAARLWDEADGGWLIHDFLVYNPTRADVEGDRESSRERMGHVRANIGRSSASPTRPLPKKPKETPEFVEFYERAYPRRVGRATALTAFLKATTRAPAEVIIKAAQDLASSPDLPDERFIPHPTTWLNRDGWLDERGVNVPRKANALTIGSPEWVALNRPWEVHQS